MQRQVVATVSMAVLFFLSPAYSQALSVGTYTGNYMFPARSGDTLIGVTLKITAVEDGVVKGTVDLNSRGPCAGEYTMAGKLEGQTLEMLSNARSGRAADCNFSFKATHEGNKLTGTTGGGRPLQLTK